LCDVAVPPKSHDEIFPVVRESDTTRPDCTLLTEFVALAVPVVGIIIAASTSMIRDAVMVLTGLIE